MVICRVTSPVTLKSNDTLHKRPLNNTKCRSIAWHYLQHGRMEDGISANQRRSFKYIERNIVQRRAQVFQTDMPNVHADTHDDMNDTKPSPKPSPRKAVAKASEYPEKLDKHDKENVERLSVAERAKLFADEPDDSDSSRSGKSLERKPPVSPKKPSLAKKPSLHVAKDEASQKPERPPVPTLHRPSVAEVSPRTETDSTSDPSPSVASEVPNDSLPKYATVNKPKTPAKLNGHHRDTKTNGLTQGCAFDSVVLVPPGLADCGSPKKVFLENITLKPVEKRLVEPVVSSASLQAKEESTPPPKPPRTFAHDQYLAVKAAKRRVGRVQSCPSPVEEVARPAHIYEEIKACKDDHHQDGHNEKSHSRAVIYEEVKDNDDHISVNRPVRTNSSGYSYVSVEVDNGAIRPAPPPRPPQPKGLASGPNAKLDSPVVRVNKHSSQADSRDIVRKKSITNPGYEMHQDFIPIKTFRSPTGEMKRYKSDEFLYADPKTEEKHVNFAEAPLYQDPAEVVTRSSSTHVPPGTVPDVDAEGYAIPDTRRHTHTYHRQAREKVSRAYSVLRKRPTPEGISELPGQTPTNEDDRDSEVDLEEHKKRLQHVSSLKEKTYNAVNWTMSMKKCRFAKLFHYSLVVGLKKLEDQNTYKPFVMASVPIKEEEQVSSILDFCFPDADSWRPVTQYSSESFCFVLTNEDGSRKYGYCRRILPPGDTNRLPEVYCVISPIGAFNLYEQLMQKVESLRQQSLEAAQSLLRAAFSRTFPDPGQEAWINLRLDSKRETVILKRSMEERLESISFGPLLSHLSIDNMLKVYASLLLERRIIFTAQHLGTLSSCIQGIVSLLYPYTWQHVYIPVLPASMLEICCSPTPFVIGILATSVPRLQDLPLDEVMIVDLDNNNLLRCIGDETTIIPRKIQRALVASLKDDSDVQGSKDTVVFEAFLRLFVETMGHYPDCISTQQDGQNVFQKDIFCRAVSSRSIRMFLEWFVETQMFEVFITVRTEQGVPEDGYFERRVSEYQEEMAVESNKFKDNVKEFGRKMMNFVRESGGKIKKALGGNSRVYV